MLDAGYSQAGVVLWVASEHDDLESLFAGAEQHALHAFPTRRVGEREGIIEDHRETSAMFGGQYFGGGEADSGLDLLN